MDDLTGFQRDILYVSIGLDAPSGQEIREELKRYYETDINHGRLYPNLDDLVDSGYLEKGQIDRRTNSYELTDDGRRLVEERERWEAEYLQPASVAASQSR